jgi:hypothetical protein
LLILTSLTGPVSSPAAEQSNRTSGGKAIDQENFDEAPSSTHSPRMVQGDQAAIADAQEAEPFGELIGQPVTDANLFHLAPLVCLKFRGKKLVGREANRVTETALANYVVSSDPDGVDHGLESKPWLAFAVCYVTAHLALDLVVEKRAEVILNYCDQHLEEGR